MDTSQEPVEVSNEVVGDFTDLLMNSLIDPLIYPLNTAKIQKQIPLIIHSALKEQNSGLSESQFDKDGFLETFTVHTDGEMLADITMKIFERTEFSLNCLLQKDVTESGKEAPYTVYLFDCRILGLHISEMPEFEEMLEAQQSPYEEYMHHGLDMMVRKEDKGKHREHCLCYNCAFFFPETLNNCHKAQEIYDNCVDLDVVTPVWECADFVPKEDEEELLCHSCECNGVELERLEEDMVETERVA
jgi:hypothetical protein